MTTDRRNEIACLLIVSKIKDGKTLPDIGQAVSVIADCSPLDASNFTAYITAKAKLKIRLEDDAVLARMHEIAFSTLATMLAADDIEIPGGLLSYFRSISDKTGCLLKEASLFWISLTSEASKKALLLKDHPELQAK